MEYVIEGNDGDGFLCVWPPSERPVRVAKIEGDIITRWYDEDLEREGETREDALIAYAKLTRKSAPHGTTTITTWQGIDGYYGCTHGIAAGLYSESEDSGPYPTRQAAIDGIVYALEDANNDQ